MPGIKLQTSGRIMHALDHWAISPCSYSRFQELDLILFSNSLNINPTSSTEKANQLCGAELECSSVHFLKREPISLIPFLGHGSPFSWEAWRQGSGGGEKGNVSRKGRVESGNNHRSRPLALESRPWQMLRDNSWKVFTGREAAGSFKESIWVSSLNTTHQKLP